MLRALVGDEAFFDVLSHFLHRYAFDAVDTADFIRSVKTVTGQNLDWFFDQWLFKPGHPVFDVRSDWDPARKVETMRVAQVQDFSKGIPVFRVPVTVAVVTPEGKTSTTVWVRGREETFEFPAASRPLLVRFDEGNVLIKEVTFPKPVEELVYQLRYDDVIGRMAAAADLVRFKDDPRVFDALAQSALGDPFWAVRRATVDAIGKIPGAQSRAALTRGSADANSSVRAAAVAALGDVKDAGLVDFFRERFERDASDLVRTEAVRAIGKTGSGAAIPILERASAVPSHRHMVQKAAAEALAQLRRDRQP
jgi:aminopeptidase N